MAGPNVLLVVLDSVRARNCSLYGHDNETTPRLAALAERPDATVFEQARAPSIHSVASHASIFSGLHVPEHDVVEHESSLDPAATVWHELATDHGYATGLFSPNVIVTESSNLAAPFETLVGAKRDADPRPFADALAPTDLEGTTGPVEYLRAALGDDRPLRSLVNGVHDQFAEGAGLSQDPEREHADVYVDELLSWVDGQSGPWAACLNLMDAHYPYVPDPEHDRWGGPPIEAIHDDLVGEPLARAFLGGRPWGQLRAVESLYDGTIHQVDAAVDRLADALESRGVLSETLVVVTSDHGEGFGERSRVTPETRLVGHSWGIHEALTHVPLVVIDPTADDSERAGTRVSRPATLTRFPDAARAAVADESVVDAFVPDGEPVVASTYRVPPPGDQLPLDPGERDPYLGPWRAVYRETIPSGGADGPADANADGAADATDDGTGDANDAGTASRGESGVTKFVTHDADAAAVRVRDAQVAYRVTRSRDGSADESAGDPTENSPRSVVESVYDSLEPAGVTLSDGTDRDLDQDTEQRLEELGYLR
jgi:arylsulfatase A-like enzyme